MGTHAEGQVNFCNPSHAVQPREVISLSISISKTTMLDSWCGRAQVSSTLAGLFPRTAPVLPSPALAIRKPPLSRIEVDSLREWLAGRGLKSGFFFPDK